MTDYMNMYNERYMKEAPRYTAGSQARTYQDYMRNIQMQRQTAGQTFGNLAAQQANQSFYDRAVGQPQGLSGGMEQQYSNVTNAQRAQQAGQLAQQRYQAFADIAAQQAQVPQLARAEAIAEQQFQAGQMQLNTQRFAQAKQIMDTPNLTQAQKVEQLKNIGMTEGEISRMNAPTAGPVVGSVMSAGALGGITTAVGTYQNVKLMSNLVGEQGSVVAANNVVETATTSLTDATTKLTDAQKKFDAVMNNTSSTDKAKTAAQKALNKARDAEKVAQAAKKEAVKKASVARNEAIEKIVKGKSARSTAYKQGAKKISLSKAKIGKIVKASGTAKGGALGATFGKAAGIALKGISIYFAVDMAVTVLTGKGIIGNVTSLVQGEGFAKGGIIGLASNRQEGYDAR